MPRPAKGPRLYLRRGRLRDGKVLPDVYFIRDGSTEIGTGCGPDRLGEAERALAAYIASKWTPAVVEHPNGPRDPARVYLAEVMAYYMSERAPKLASAEGIAFRSVPLLAFWGEKTVADIKRSSCEAYVAWRTAQRLRQARRGRALERRVTDQAARRELEDLSAAIGFFDDEFSLTKRPKVVLPEKPDSPRDALTRSQVAALLKAARGYRKGPDGCWIRIRGSSAGNRAHLSRFVLIGIYTGTRPGLIPRVLWEESPASPWVNLESGTIFRRGRDERESRTKRKPLVRVPPRLLAHLRRWRRLDLIEAERRRLKDPDAPPIVSVIHHGGVPLVGRIRTAFEGAVADAGLDPKMTPHWLRHTCATLLLEGGAELWDAAAYTGMTVATLEKHYGHHRPDHQERARRAAGGRKRT